MKNSKNKHSIQKIGDFILKTGKERQRLSELEKQQSIQLGTLYQPVFKKLIQKNPQLASRPQDNSEILKELGRLAIVDHPKLYKTFLEGQLAYNQGKNYQWDNAVTYGIPLIRVEEDIFRIVLECEPPKNIELWKEESTPAFPTRYYIPPQGVFKIDTSPIIMIGLSILSPEEFERQNEQTLGRAELHKRYALLNEKPNQGLFYVCLFVQGACYESIQPIIDGRIEEITKVRNPGSTDEENYIIKNLVNIGIQLLLLENNYPKWHKAETESPLLTTTGKPTGKIGYYPKIIGAYFPHKSNRKTQPTETGHKRPCEHWRGAHWKSVAYGPKMGLRRQQLILPCIVNPGVE
jgi:hypothetical protein